MATSSLKQSVIVIVGPTASGKTSAAIEVAKEFNGEVICADSRTVYRDMNIGTAKPTDKEMDGIKHWGLDLVHPNQRFTAADFKAYAIGMIKDIRSRGKLPIVVGGTGLYINGLLYNYKYSSRLSEDKLKKFEEMSVQRLQQYCEENNIRITTSSKNKRHLISAISQEGQRNRLSVSDLQEYIVVGIATGREQLNHSIRLRTEHMFLNGVVEEAIMLGKKYGWDHASMTGNIYPILHKFTTGELDIEEAKDEFCIRDRQLAKRQMTWFRSNPFIEWCLRHEVSGYVRSRLAD